MIRVRHRFTQRRAKAANALAFAGALLATSANATQPIHGTLSLDTDARLALEVLRDDYGFAGMPARRVDYLPGFRFDYVQDGRRLIPLQRGTIPSEHPHWEYILEPGRISQQNPDSGYSQASLPLTLHERDANCMHYGLLSFELDDAGVKSPARLHLSSETCPYFKFDLNGSLSLSYTPVADMAGGDAIIRERRNLGARLPVTPLAELSRRYPQVDINAFRGSSEVAENDITVSGFFVDDAHYGSECRTRTGAHPFCNELSLPSYSLAKTLFASLGLMRMERLYPGTRAAVIADYVPECRASGNWDDVSFSDALDMRSGNFGSDGYLVDENSRRTDDGFFFTSSHRQKIEFSCNAWPRRAAPGLRWVYHTTDTYILGTAMNARFKRQLGPEADVFNNLLLPMWDTLALSPALSVTRRTAGQPAQPFTGFGLTLQRDDIVRLAVALNRGFFQDLVDVDMLQRAMYSASEPEVEYAVAGKYRHTLGFWGYDATVLLDCDSPLIIPFMSGFGGINVVMMPNDTVYYIFSDGNQFNIADAIQQSDRIRPMCPMPGANTIKQ